MMCPRFFQTDLARPVCRLWPHSWPLLFQLRRSMEDMERLHFSFFQEMDSIFRKLGAHSFALSLDTEDFSPEELSVTQQGRRLRVSGRMERSQGDRSSSSCRCQEFQQDLDLPQGVDPETVSCALVGGWLHIWGPREKVLSDGKERIVPIKLISSPHSGEAEKHCALEN